MIHLLHTMTLAEAIATARSMGMTLEAFVKEAAAALGR